MDTKRAKEFLKSIDLIKPGYSEFWIHWPNRDSVELSKILTEFSNQENNEREQRLVGVLKELCYLNSCEQEGIESSMPLMEDWYKTFQKAEQLLEELQS